MGSLFLLLQAKDFFGLKSPCELFSDLPSGQFTSCFFLLLSSGLASLLLSQARFKDESERWMDGRCKRNHKNCSSAKIVLIFSKVMFCSYAKKQSFEVLYFSLSFSSFPFPVIPFLPLPLAFLFLHLLFFFPIFRATILCEESRSILFTDPR